MMPRFYVNLPLAPSRTIVLPEEAVRHMKVLRLCERDEITLFNGDGYEYLARRFRDGNRRIAAEILSAQKPLRESPLRLVLLQAVSAGERMDLTIRKSVELGVSLIQPLCSERSRRPAGEIGDKRLRRWRDIVVSACEQSGRNEIPEVMPICAFAEVLSLEPQARRCLLSPRGGQNLRSFGSTSSLVLLAGAEGGFSPEEENAAVDAGFVAVKTGNRVLRTETAAVAAMAAAQVLWGDF